MAERALSVTLYGNYISPRHAAVGLSSLWTAKSLHSSWNRGPEGTRQDPPSWRGCTGSNWYRGICHKTNVYFSYVYVYATMEKNHDLPQSEQWISDNKTSSSLMIVLRSRCFPRLSWFPGSPSFSYPRRQRQGRKRRKRLGTRLGLWLENFSFSWVRAGLKSGACRRFLQAWFNFNLKFRGKARGNSIVFRKSHRYLTTQTPGNERFTNTESKYCRIFFKN